MAVESKADPIMEPPFKGITDDIKARAPLILDDFKQGISTKSLVRDPFIFPWIFLWFPRELSARSAHDAPLARRLETYRNTPLRARIRYPFFREARHDPRDPARARPLMAISRPTWSLPRGKTWFKFCPSVVPSWHSSLATSTEKNKLTAPPPPRYPKPPPNHQGFRLLPFLRRPRACHRLRRRPHLCHPGHARRD